MPYFRQHSLAADDARRLKVYRNFRSNLEAICRTVTHSGAKAILCTVAVNLQDCPPFESKHRPDLSAQAKDSWDHHYQSGIKLEAQGQHQSAISEYLQAAGIDDQYAELLFRLARCYRATHDVVHARQYYAKARDWDALQFRADDRLNSVIRDVARSYESTGISLLDIDEFVRQNDVAEEGIPGNRLFHEHVHPTFTGNCLIARACFDKLVRQLALPESGLKPEDFPNEEQCAAAVAYTEFDNLEVQAAFLRLTASPPFLDQLEHEQRQAAAKSRYEQRRAEFTPATTDRCLATYKNAIHQEPDFWPLRFNLGNLYQQLSQPNLAVEQFRSIVQQFPHTKRFHHVLANALLATGDKPAAIGEFEQALLLDPHDLDLKQTIQRLRQ
jgi:tetratricopeptide (TPR) repeat protein